MATYMAPIDFSPEGTAAVQEAARRAHLNGAELLLLNVFSVPGLAEQIGHPRAFPPRSAPTSTLDWKFSGLPR
jgi:hypothetical protein